MALEQIHFCPLLPSPPVYFGSTIDHVPSQLGTKLFCLKQCSYTVNILNNVKVILKQTTQ